MVIGEFKLMYVNYWNNAVCCVDYSKELTKYIPRAKANANYDKKSSP